MRIELWWAQIKAILRLEMRKTFFARRGLWIYLLALLPVALFLVHTLVTANENQVRARIATENEKPLSSRDLATIKIDMSSQEVIARLGKPPLLDSWRERRPTGPNSFASVRREKYRYSNGESDLYLDFENGKVTGITLGRADNLGEDSIIFAGVYQFFYLRLAIFFGCLGVFMNLFRGELLDKSLHFYFLAPVRREVVMVGKYFAGLIATIVIFTTSEALQILAFAWHFDSNALGYMLHHGHGFAQAGAYLGVTALACIGYGSIFLAIGLTFRNPILPVLGLLVWEAANPFLPTVLQKFSVIWYLKSLCPVGVPASPGTPPILALFISPPDPMPAPVAIFGLVSVSLLILFVSSFQVRRMEINYTTE